MLLGYFFSIIISVLFAVYAFPRKYSKQNVILYTMWMGVAYFCGTLILIFIVWGFGFEKAENLFSPWHLLTVLRGLVWVFGMAAYNLAIDKIGLTRFNQWKNVQGPVGSLLILLILPDISGIKLMWLFIGMTVMFASALMFQILTEREKLKLAESKKNTRAGIALALFSGICFGCSALLNSIVSRPNIVGETFTFTQLLYHSLSLIIFSAVFYIILGEKNKDGIKQPLNARFKSLFKVNKKTWLPVLAGGMYLRATFLTIYTYRLIPNTVAWSITQLNVFWTVLAGVFIYKEVSFKKHYLRLTGGALMAVAACIALFFAL